MKVTFKQSETNKNNYFQRNYSLSFSWIMLFTNVCLVWYADFRLVTVLVIYKWSPAYILNSFVVIL